MDDPCFSTLLKSPEHAASAAEVLAQNVAPGDVILLNGPVGSGKSHFSRSMIRSILKVPEDIPSPTFTLVQSYETTKGPLWHSDLYRIGSTQEIEELGLLEAFEEAICLIEWPDRLGELAPGSALSLWLDHGPDTDSRTLNACWTDEKWQGRTAGWGTL